MACRVCNCTSAQKTQAELVQQDLQQSLETERRRNEARLGHEVVSYSKFGCDPTGGLEFRSAVGLEGE